MASSKHHSGMLSETTIETVLPINCSPMEGGIQGRPFDSYAIANCIPRKSL
jgi:hypothetical protein